MFIYMSHFMRYVSGSIISPGTSFSSYYFIHRRFYADKKSSLNHYDALGIHSNASAKEIKAAFYKLSKKHHPDVNLDDVNATTKFSTISNAYDILNDPMKRREYDNELLSKTSVSDPYVAYDRTSTYAQRARAHRPSTWRPPSTSSYSNRGFQENENSFGNKRSYETFDETQYDASFGRYRDPPSHEDSNKYDFDEFYRTHYSNSMNRHQMRKEAQEEGPETNRKIASKLAEFLIGLCLGLVAFFTSTLLHEMHFQQPTEEFRSRIVRISKSSNGKSYRQSSSKN